MANDLSPFSPELWSNDIQGVFFRENLALELADTTMDGLVMYGDTLNKPYAQPLVDSAYTKGTAVTISDQTPTNEYLSVATARQIGGYYDDIKVCVFA